MGHKKLTRQWRKGKVCFPSVYGVKNGFARDLIIMGDIEVPKAEQEKALKNPAKYLESHGWKWEKRKENTDE